ncbi:MAG: tetratricopeptide repeat protein [Gammaproteobacteria bacterium]
MRKLSDLSVAFALCLAVVAAPARADFNDGVAALVAGNYDQALNTFVPLAETSDHSYAQYFLARMYADGRGVDKNPVEAAKWFRKAAEKGIQDAQYRLGGMYERGEGVPQDMEYAYGWYSVSAHTGNPKADASLEAAAARLDANELHEAQALARDLIAKYGAAKTTGAR